MNDILILIISSIWAIVLSYRLLLSPLPKPVDVLSMSLFYYNVPLIILTTWFSDAELPFNVFLNRAARDIEFAEKDFLLVFISTSVIYLSAFIFGLITSKKNYIIYINANLRLQKKSLNLTILSLIGVIIGLYLYGYEEFFSGYNVESLSPYATSGTALIFFLYEAIGFFVFFWLVCAKINKSYDRGWVIVIALLFLTFLTLIRGKRLEFLISVLPVFLIYWSNNLYLVKKRVFIIIIILAAISSMAVFRQHEFPDLLSIIFNVFTEGIYAGHSTPGIVDAVDSGQLPTENGLRLITGLIASVPRFIFPWKDVVVYQSMNDITEFNPLGASSMLGEIYLQGGLISLVIIFIFLGFISKYLEMSRLYESSSKYISLRSIFYLIFVCAYIPHLRDGMIASTKMFMQLTIVILMLIPTVRLVNIRQFFNRQ